MLEGAIFGPVTVLSLIPIGRSRYSECGEWQELR
jgi:hypothetical protein